MNTNNPFIGTWRLLSWENKGPDGQVTYPYGQEPVGYLVYTAEGFMSVQIMDPDRRQGSEKLLPEPVSGQTLSGEDKVMAYNTYQAYCGFYTYSMEDKVVTHAVKTGLIPGWTGKDQVRHFEFTKEYLILSTESARLIWERIISHA